MPDSCVKSHSLAEVAEALSVCVRTVESWIANRELRAVNVSRARNSRKPRLRVLQADLDAFLAKRATDVATEPRTTRNRRRRIPVKEFV